MSALIDFLARVIFRLRLHPAPLLEGGCGLARVAHVPVLGFKVENGHGCIVRRVRLFAYKEFSQTKTLPTLE
jgi:hypothetical protein